MRKVAEEPAESNPDWKGQNTVPSPDLVSPELRTVHTTHPVPALAGRLGVVGGGDSTSLTQDVNLLDASPGMPLICRVRTQDREERVQAAGGGETKPLLSQDFS